MCPIRAVYHKRYKGADMGNFLSQPTFQQELKQWCHKYEVWPYVVHNIQDDNQWKLMVEMMFEEEVYSRGRLGVIKILTDDIVERLQKQGNLKQAGDIERTYSKWLAYIMKENVFPHAGATLCNCREKVHSLSAENKALKKKYKHRGGSSDIELQMYKDNTNKLIKELEEENYYLNAQLDAYMGPYMQALSRRKRRTCTHYRPAEASLDQLD